MCRYIHFWLYLCGDLCGYKGVIWHLKKLNGNFRTRIRDYQNTESSTC